MWRPCISLQLVAKSAVTGTSREENSFAHVHENSAARFVVMSSELRESDSERESSSTKSFSQYPPLVQILVSTRSLKHLKWRKIFNNFSVGAAPKQQPRAYRKKLIYWLNRQNKIYSN